MEKKYLLDYIEIEIDSFNDGKQSIYETNKKILEIIEKLREANE